MAMHRELKFMQVTGMLYYFYTKRSFPKFFTPKGNFCLCPLAFALTVRLQGECVSIYLFIYYCSTIFFVGQSGEMCTFYLHNPRIHANNA